MVQNGPKIKQNMVQIVKNGQNGLKWFNMVQSGPKWSKFLKKGQKWSNKVQNCQTRFKMAGLTLSGPDLPAWAPEGRSEGARRAFS